MIVRDYELLLMEYDTYRVKKYVSLCVPPILITIGTIGNIISFLILRKCMMRISTYFYLAILAVADLMVLQLGLLRKWTGELTGVDIRNKSNWICKTLVTLNYVSSDFSSWLLVVVTAERYIAVCYPLQATVLCSFQKARSVTVIIFGVIVLANCHFLWTIEVSYIHLNLSSEARCEATADYEHFISDIWPWIDTALYSFIPCVCLSVLNILIIRQVLVARRCRYQLQNCKSGRNNLLQRKLPTEGSIKLTIMLLTVSFAFIVTTLPNNISIIIYTLWDFSSSVDIFRDTSDFALLLIVTEMLMYINHSINFILYCATGKKFRRMMKTLVCRMKGYRRPGSENSANSLLMCRVRYSTGNIKLNNVCAEPRILRSGTEL